jgi:hypothetical protein
LDETTHLEAKRLAKKKGLSFSRLTEELLSRFVKEEWKKEEMQQTVEQKKLEEADKGERLAREYMKKLLFDPNYCPEGWVETSY